jgi:hypothetical protein
MTSLVPEMHESARSLRSLACGTDLQSVSHGGTDLQSVSRGWTDFKSVLQGVDAYFARAATRSSAERNSSVKRVM